MRWEGQISPCSDLPVKPAGLVGGTSAWTLPSSSSSEMVSPQSTHVQVCVVCVCRVHHACTCVWGVCVSGRRVVQESRTV